MKTTLWITGGILGILGLAVLFACRAFAWICALTCGLLLLLGLLGGGERALLYALICFVAAVIAHALPTALLAQRR